MDKELETAFESRRIEAKQVYSIIACKSVDELAKAVSEKLGGGMTRLYGPPFVFGDQVCQTITLGQH
jgi:hypothetical protein